MPGFNVIRAVTRIILVLMFPAALVAIVGLRSIAGGIRPKVVGVALASLFVLAAFYEITAIKKSSFSIVEADARVDAIVAGARERANGIDRPILALNAAHDGHDDGYLQIDAMLASLRLGWPTVNGYSGNDVPGTNVADCFIPVMVYGAFGVWQQKQKVQFSETAGDLIKRTVFVGWPDCRPIKTANSTFEFTSSGPPSDTLPRQVKLIAGSVERRGRFIAFTTQILNLGPERLSAFSTTPIRIAWRFVAVGAPVSNEGWNLAEDVPSDVLPHGDLTLVVQSAVPQKPGTYRLQVSLVAAVLYWFHEKGMEILTFEEPVVVP